jgi:hypothetical protein
MAEALGFLLESPENVHDSAGKAPDEVHDPAGFEQDGSPDHQQGRRDNEKHRKT